MTDKVLVFTLREISKELQSLIDVKVGDINKRLEERFNIKQLETLITTLIENNLKLYVINFKKIMSQIL